MEEITKAQQAADLLLSDLRELASEANKNENFALAILARQMMATTIKTIQTLNELQ